MKHFLLLSAFALITLFPQLCHAQVGMEDVVYLNNGSVLRGMIIEQVPNKSLKVQIAGGSIFHVEIGEVARITKESLAVTPSALSDSPSAPAAKRDSVQRGSYAFRPKGYFFQGQLLMELVQGGFRIVNGYRFGRFGHLGLGVGIDFSGPSISSRFNNYGGMYAATGTYVPIYLQYSGEILRTRVTPFYAVEAGYAAAVDNGMDGFDHGYHYGPRNLRGGAMWGLGIGVRFKTNRRLNFSLLLNINAKNVSYREYSYWFDDMGQNYHTQSHRVRATLVYPGLRFGIGF